MSSSKVADALRKYWEGACTDMPNSETENCRNRKNWGILYSTECAILPPQTGQNSTEDTILPSQLVNSQTRQNSAELRFTLKSITS